MIGFHPPIQTWNCRKPVCFVSMLGVVQCIGYSFVNRHWIYCTVLVLGAFYINTLVLIVELIICSTRRRGVPTLGEFISTTTTMKKKDGGGRRWWRCFCEGKNEFLILSFYCVQPRVLRS